MRTLVICLALAVGAFAASTPPPQLQEMLVQIRNMVSGMYSLADHNHNGAFDLDDLKVIFDEYDTNNDQVVTKAEFAAGFGARVPALAAVASGLFTDLDMDKNGSLEQGDIQLYYDKLDQNDDGRVTESEFNNYFQQLFEVLFILALKAQVNANAGA